ncbi:MAG: VWA domain-containing protein [Actinomycetia bacterium]|nr:VWA domain-containing protein [Actinomycetes bacterium]
MKNRRKITGRVLILLLLPLFIIASFSGFGILQAAGMDPVSGGAPMDLVLVIDESGSMKKNDPGNLRVDAARLFIELNQILTEGNRVAIVGFGEKTNIYIELTKIAKNKKDIMEAISNIKSNQNLTDMKSALEEVKSMLDERVRKNRTAVIFLTDGDLGIDDIPIPDEIREGENGRPKPPVRETEKSGNKDESDEGDGDSQSGGNIAADPQDRLNEYLEKYKAELFELCHEYQKDNIQIFPIAFTDEANIDVLEEIADITLSRLWISKNASDIRDIYLDIFKFMTGTFIYVYSQEGRERIEGNIPVGDYMGKLVVIAAANESISKPDVGLYAPSESTECEIIEIVEPSYIIKIVNKPDEGVWEYSINGDMVLAMELASVILIEPLKAVYFMNSKIPAMIQLLMPENTEGAIEYSDFEISCEIIDPNLLSTGKIRMTDDGNGADGQQGDGIFSYLFEGIPEAGDYKIEFTIDHKPTGSGVLKEQVFIVTDYQPVKKEIYLKIENNIIAGSPIKIYANFEDFSSGIFSYTVTSPDGKAISGELHDNGSMINADSSTEDGIYSNILEGFIETGKYTIEVRADYQSVEGCELYQTRETEIGKYIAIEAPEGILEIDSDSKSLKTTLKMTSIYDEDLSIGTNSQKTDKSIIKNIDAGSSILKAGSEIDMQLTIYLTDDIPEGEYIIDIPMVLGQVFTKDIGIKFSCKTIPFRFGHKTLIGLILIFLSLISLILLLYAVINLKKLNIKLTHPRIIIEFSIFILLFIAGMIVVFI